MHRLLLLLVSALLTSAQPALRRPMANQRFNIRHIYREEQLVNCNQAMNRILMTLEIGCFTSTFILGDNGYVADQNAVEQVCGDGGARVGTTDHYRSNKEFRVVTCQLNNEGARPPNCDYRAVTTADIQTRQIVLRCQGTYPIDFII